MFDDVIPSQPKAPEAVEQELTQPEWKAALRRDFEKWLAGLTDLPEAELEAEEPDDFPDLRSFYEQLATATLESRKANRRTAEAFSQWAETLARFESQLAPLRESAAQLAAAQPGQNELPRSACLLLVEFLDRMHRLAQAFQRNPQKKKWWSGPDRAWRQAWENQRQGFGILISHLEEWLRKEGVVPLDVVGQPFDPTAMTAVAAEATPDQPAQIVLEEIAAGYRRRGELLRPAQVKVSTR
jgi:molecular chaperone GrpE (heat shock protein)